ncbi:hypothetical protein RRG08_067138 [Elysia crispata]|uniref:Uncharacterized protein n=1 Tax=Elysia crispata TaxID=231223 RepID=A0AAE1DH97_9GAST|nr:hypothetical protein RRG08_067138 [Elysia crispata]
MALWHTRPGFLYRRTRAWTLGGDPRVWRNQRIQLHDLSRILAAPRDQEVSRGSTESGEARLRGCFNSGGEKQKEREREREEGLLNQSGRKRG